MGIAQQENLKDLLQHYRCSKDVKIAHRAHVVALYLKNWCVRDIAEVTFKKESTVSRWITNYKKQGIGSIFPGFYLNQNAAKLTKEQKQEVKQLLEENPPPRGFWSVGELKTYLSARFDVEYKAKQSYYAILTFCNYSYKLPSLYNIKRDDQKVEKRMKKIRDEIKHYLEDSSCLVFASDETRIEWLTLLRRAWLRKGKKTVIREKRGKRYQNFIGFLDLKTGEDVLFRLDWQDQEHIIPVLISLTEKYSDKKIVIIWDNAGFHRGKLIREQLGLGKPLERIRLIWLPPYAPDKNPQELVWRYAKDQIGNQVYNQFEQLIGFFEASVMGRKFNYQF
jgi:transposase